MLHEMMLVDDMNVRPLGHCSNLIELDLCQFSCSVLNYFSLFDPRPCPRGLLLMFELGLQVKKHMAMRELIHLLELTNWSMLN